jgi:DNA-binding NtrC family response regulator
MVSRNAATIPESIADAELFGNARGYPNPGMPERPGLVGASHGSTLFLDEIGELSQASQARLLRVLDEGEYQRLGESRQRLADIRVIGATNRQPSELKHDLLARLTLTVTVPDLNARREDIPLLIRHLLRRHANRDPRAFERFFPANSISPQLSREFVETLLHHHYTTNIRELEAQLLSAVVREPGPVIGSSYARFAAKPEPKNGPAVACKDRVPTDKAWLSDEDAQRLALLRRHRFSPTSCGRDPAYPGNRQTADLHFRYLVCRALAHGNWETVSAARLLAGDDDPSLVTKCSMRIEKFVSHLCARVAAEPAAQLELALRDDWRMLAPAVLGLVDALRTTRARPLDVRQGT